ncbi:MAG: hypothetical protein U1E53_23830 [Dongiaceae bacterium]
MRRGRAWTGLAAMLVLASLGGCFIPDRFQATLIIVDWRSYELEYQGRLYALDFLQDLRRGTLEPKSPLLAEVAQWLHEKPGVDLVRHKQGATYEIAADVEGALSNGIWIDLYRTPILKVDWIGDNIAITLSPLSRKGRELELRDLAAAGLGSRGRFCIATLLPVVRQNAQEAYAADGLRHYCWQSDDWINAAPPIEILLHRPAEGSWW